MQLQFLVGLLGASTAFAAALPAIEERQTTCSTNHIIVARASGEAAGTGIIGTLSLLVQLSNLGTTVEALDYPATLDNYTTSSATGTANLKARLVDYTTKCPKAKVVLLGYSQGAHVVLDAMCGGGGGTLGPETPAVTTSVGDKVQAIIQMGDPRHTVGKTYDAGTATLNGLFPRLPSQSCDRYASKIRAYCDFDDPYCANGTDYNVHSTYVFRYNFDALGFVNSKI